MSTILPPSPLPTCLNCAGWGCRTCRNPYEVHAASGGEQGLTATELELLALRNEAANLRAQLEAGAIEREEQRVELARAYEHIERAAESIEALADTITILSTEVPRG